MVERQAVHDIRSSGAEAHVMDGLALHHRAWLAARRRAFLAAALLFSASTLSFAVGNAISFGIGAYLSTQRLITLWTVYLLFRYTDILRQPIYHVQHDLDH